MVFNTTDYKALQSADRMDFSLSHREILEKKLSQEMRTAMYFFSFCLSISQRKHASACANSRIKYRKYSAIFCLVKEHSQATISYTAKKERTSSLI